MSTVELDALRVGVLGASGALGTDLLPHLAAAKHVVALLEPLTTLAPALVDDVEVRHIDVTEPEHLRSRLHGLDAVVNAAGLPYPVEARLPAMWEVNAVGAHNVAWAAVAAGVETLVHVSSTAAVGYPPDGYPADESFAFDDSVTTTAYAVTKRRGEQMVRQVCGDRLRLVVLNPAAVLSTTGHHAYGWPALLRRLARLPVHTVPPGGSAFCGASDLAVATSGALRLGRHGRRYIVTSENLTYRELFARVARLVGRRVPTVRLPARLARTAGRMAGVVNALLPRDRSLMFDRGVAELMTRTLFYTSATAGPDLGFVPHPVDEDLARLLGVERSLG